MDSAGIRWFLKLDAPGYPEQATGAEVVATKLFWALGYNVAETHVATLRPGDLVLSEKATIKVNGERRPLTEGDVRRVLGLAERSPDGTYRVLASKELEGKSVGEFLYYGTRADDPNDLVPHENRRELRGMGVFAAWIDRVDAKAGNTLDTLVKENGKTIVRHHPLDFGPTLGSDPRCIKKLMNTDQVHRALVFFFGMSSPADADNPKFFPLFEDSSPINHLTRNDPPILVFFSQRNDPLPANSSGDEHIHHPKFGFALKEKAARLGVECTLILREDHPEGFPVDRVAEFFKTKLNAR